MGAGKKFGLVITGLATAILIFGKVWAKDFTLSLIAAEAKAAGAKEKQSAAWFKFIGPESWTKFNFWEPDAKQLGSDAVIEFWFITTCVAKERLTTFTDWGKTAAKALPCFSGFWAPRPLKMPGLINKPKSAIRAAKTLNLEGFDVNFLSILLYFHYSI